MAYSMILLSNMLENPNPSKVAGPDIKPSVIGPSQILEHAQGYLGLPTHPNLVPSPSGFYEKDLTPSSMIPGPTPGSIDYNQRLLAYWDNQARQMGINWSSQGLSPLQQASLLGG